MNTFDLILWMAFLVIVYLCYEKWRTDKLIEKKTEETYKKIMDRKHQQSKLQNNIRNKRATPIHNLHKETMSNIVGIYLFLSTQLSNALLTTLKSYSSSFIHQTLKVSRSSSEIPAFVKSLGLLTVLQSLIS